jgi:hypothetical protein
MPEVTEHNISRGSTGISPVENKAAVRRLGKMGV